MKLEGGHARVTGASAGIGRELARQLGGRADTTIQDQTTTALNSMRTILESAGSSMANVVKCTVFLVDIKDFQGMNASSSAAFPMDPPAGSTVPVAAPVTASG